MIGAKRFVNVSKTVELPKADIMARDLPKHRQSTQIKRYALSVVLLWTALVVLSAGLSAYNTSHSAQHAALIEARASFTKDQMYRHWAAMHGGVYVPVSEHTPPNPFLDVPHRDIETTDGQELTLVNPAYMTRQVYELAHTLYNNHSRITSLDPIRPGNAPDSWEAAALSAIESGDTEYSSIEMLNGQPTLRYVGVMVTKQECLVCHEDQGYNVGDVRGGISVSVPMAPYWEANRSTQTFIYISHGILWLFGLGLTVFGTRHLLSGEAHAKHITTQLAESETRYRDQYSELQRFFDVSSDMLCIAHKDGRLIRVNKAWESTLGYAPESLAGKYFIDFVHPADVPATLVAMNGLRDGDPVSNFHNRYRTADEDYRYLEWQSNPHEDYIYAAARDISDRVAIEQQLRASERRSRAIIEAIPDMIFRNHRDGTYLDYHAPDSDLLIVPPEMFLGRKARDILPPEMVESHYQHIETTLNTGQMQKYTYELFLQDGTHAFDARMVAIGQDEVLTIVRDITEERKTQQRTFELALERERRQLLGAFIEDVAHEFRTPLSTISTGTHIMARSDDPERRAAKAVQIANQIKRITRLVDALLLMVRLDNDPADSFTTVDLDIILDGVQQDLRAVYSRPISFQPDPDADRPRINGNPAYLTEAFKQILDNACRFTPDDGHISVKVVTADNQVIVTITDTGIGIPDDAVPHIFDTFWRQDNSHTTPGFGLGLPLARKIIELHNGTITVDSQEDEGTTIRVTFSPKIVPNTVK